MTINPAAFDTRVLKQVATEIDRVKAEYGGLVSEASIDLVAGEYLHKLAGSKVPQFVPLFVGRFTRKRLQELTGLRPRVRVSAPENLRVGEAWPPRVMTAPTFE